MSFEKSLGFTARWEGGESDDVDDPGGRTFVGITQASFSKWLKVPLENCQDVFTATGDQVASFYRAYWAGMSGEGYDRIDERLSLLMFDAAVQHGPSLAVEFLQLAIGAEPDGKFGPKTYSTLQTVYEDTPQILLDDLVMHRRDHYHERALKPQLTKFLPGWLARVDDCQAAADTTEAGLINVVRNAHSKAPLPIAIDGVS